LTAQLPGPAQEKVDRFVEQFRKELIEEAERLESRQNVAGGPQEITATHIHSAYEVIHNGLQPRKRPADVGLLIAANLGSITVGVATNHLDKIQGVIVFAVAVGTAILCGTILYFRN
jgi:hypothetical protein